jgi:hypothetical protein
VPDAAPSPQASAEPAPLANVGAAASAAATATSGLDGSALPEVLRGDREVPADSPHEVVHELGAKDVPRDPKELSGYEMQVVLHTGEGPGAPKGPEVNQGAIDAARHKTEARLTVDASLTRARFVLAQGFVLPAGTELRARDDRYGHVLLWPDEGGYRIAEPGAMRALLGERRLDVVPVSPVETTVLGEGARRLNVRTRHIELSTRAAKATLEVAAFQNAGDGGVLVCRWLLDLMGGPPAAAPCASDEVPLHAELRWTTQGSLSFDVTSITPRKDLAVGDLAAPPASLGFLRGAPPVPPGEALLAKADEAALRSAPSDVPPARGVDAAAPPVDVGLLLVNASDSLRVAWLDGVAIAWAGPGGSVALPGLVRGRYSFQWRSFLGDAWEVPQTVVVPGRVELASGENAPR